MVKLSMVNFEEAKTSGEELLHLFIGNVLFGLILGCCHCFVLFDSPEVSPTRNLLLLNKSVNEERSAIGGPFLRLPVLSRI